jgi:hypothetical protein
MALSTGFRELLSTAGGTQAVWNPNVREIFYRIDDTMTWGR